MERDSETSALAPKGKARRGESCVDQDADRRVESQLRILHGVVEALTNFEKRGTVTSFIVAVVRSDGVSAVDTSQNLEAWRLDGVDKLLDEAVCGKWSITQRGEEQIQQSRDKFPSYTAGLQGLNLGDLRKLLREMGFDGMRKQCNQKKDIPPHMVNMLDNRGQMYFDLGEVKVSSDEVDNNGQKSKHDDVTANRGDADDDDDDDEPERRARHDKHGTDGTFVQSQSQRSPEELMRFGSWEKKQENEDEEIDEERYLSLERLLDRSQTKISNITRSTGTVALRLLLEFLAKG